MVRPDLLMTSCRISFCSDPRVGGRRHGRGSGGPSVWSASGAPRRAASAIAGVGAVFSRVARDGADQQSSEAGYVRSAGRGMDISRIFASWDLRCCARILQSRWGCRRQLPRPEAIAWPRLPEATTPRQSGAALDPPGRAGRPDQTSRPGPPANDRRQFQGRLQRKTLSSPPCRPPREHGTCRPRPRVPRIEKLYVPRSRGRAGGRVVQRKPAAFTAWRARSSIRHTSPRCSQSRPRHKQAGFHSENAPNLFRQAGHLCRARYARRRGLEIRLMLGEPARPLDLADLQRRARRNGWPRSGAGVAAAQGASIGHSSDTNRNDVGGVLRGAAVSR